MIIDNVLQAELFDRYRIAERKMILLDYDGSLVEYKPKPDQAIPSESLLNILHSLAIKPENELMVISGRDHKDIDSLLGSLPIDIIAEHGAIMKQNGIWRNQVPDDVSWKDAIMPVLAGISLKCADSYVEEKHFSLAWHYRNIEENPGFACSRELINELQKFLKPLALKVLDGNKVVEIMHEGIGKGIAVQKLLARKEYDFILSIGDDVTDEEIFALFLQDEKAVTIKVGNTFTFAKYNFYNVNDVILFLKHLSE
jgi:trehalose 6-phosphate synthase/phosphatase